MRYESPLVEAARQSHRRAPRPCGAPAVTAHIGFWHRLQASSGETAAEHISNGAAALSAAYQEINAAIHRFQELLGIPVERRKRFVDSHGGDAPEHYLPLEFEFGGLIGKAVFSRNSEAVSATFIIDLSKEPGDQLYPLPGRWVREAADNLKAGFADLAGQLPRPSNPGRLQGHADYLYEGFWALFFRNLEIEAIVGRGDGDWQKFVDVRGVVLNVGDENNVHRVKAEPLPHDFLNVVPSFDSAESAEALHRVWPFVQASHTEARDVEFVMNKVLAGRALFVSAFGDLGVGIARPKSPPARAGSGVVRYLVMTNGLGATRLRPGSQVEVPFNRWQIGRLVFRLHELATMRMMALRDLRLVKGAGQQAMVLGSRLDELYRRQTQGKQTTRDQINDLFKALNNLGSDAVGGLSYRINRSRLMAQGYKQTLLDLEIERVDGCQPYDEFVRRRLYHEFDTIDRIGIRVENLSKRAANLLSLVDTTNQLENGRDLAKLTSQLASNQAVMAESERRIEHLQRRAEILISLAAVYYVGSMLDKATIYKWLTAACLQHRTCGDTHAIDAAISFFSAVPVVFLVMLMWTKWPRRRPRQA